MVGHRLYAQIKSSKKLGSNLFPELNYFSIAKTDTKQAVYCSNNTESGLLYTILLSVMQPLSELQDVFIPLKFSYTD